MYIGLTRQPVTGTEVSTIQATNPSYLSISPDGKHVYAASEDEKEGAVIAYAFEPSTGRLAFIKFPVQSGQLHLLCYRR